jgi:hypothetical protein
VELGLGFCLSSFGWWGFLIGKHSGPKEKKSTMLLIIVHDNKKKKKKKDRRA